MRDDPGLVVVNATPVIALSLIGKLDLLNQLYEFVQSIAPLIERLRDGGIHLSDSVVEEALRLADEL